MTKVDGEGIYRYCDHRNRMKNIIIGTCSEYCEMNEDRRHLESNLSLIKGKHYYHQIVPASIIYSVLIEEKVSKTLFLMVSVFFDQSCE